MGTPLTMTIAKQSLIFGTNISSYINYFTDNSTFFSYPPPRLDANASLSIDNITFSDFVTFSDTFSHALYIRGEGFAPR
jgi:hypothetical protein